MPGDIFVHPESFDEDDLADARKKLRRILQNHFEQLFGYSNSKLLYSAARTELSMFINSYDCGSEEKIYAIARFLMSDTFFFPSGNGRHIFAEKPDFDISAKGILINYARNQNGRIIDIEKARDYLSKVMLSVASIYQTVDIDSGSEFMFYDSRRIVLKEALELTDEKLSRISEMLSDLFGNDIDYIVPRLINDTWLRELPLPVGVCCTLPLLCHIISVYSDKIGFRCIKPKLKGASVEILPAAIVPAASELTDFNDLLMLLVRKFYKLPVTIRGDKLRSMLCDEEMIEHNKFLGLMRKVIGDDPRFVWSDDRNVTVRDF